MTCCQWVGHCQVLPPLLPLQAETTVVHYVGKALRRLSAWDPGCGGPSTPIRVGHPWAAARCAALVQRFSQWPVKIFFFQTDANHKTNIRTEFFNSKQINRVVERPNSTESKLNYRFYVQSQLLTLELVTRMWGQSGEPLHFTKI